MISKRNILLSMAGAVYLGVSYIATTMPHPPILILLIGLVPLGAAALATALKSRARALLVSLLLVFALFIGINLDALRDHVPWVYFIQHAGAMTLLGLTFGGTIGRNPAEALCSRIAEFIVPGPLDADYFRYTWKVTLAWTIYFTVSAVLSVVLFFFAPIKVWAVFATILTPIALGLMFVGEYLIRRRVMPEGAHLRIAVTIKAYRDFSQRTDSP
jgi:uncharacterized membrane protein